MPIDVACVVEGHGEVRAIRTVIERIATAAEVSDYLRFPSILRIPRSKLVKQEEFNRAIELSSRALVGVGCVFALIDSDDDCPAVMGPRLLGWARENYRQHLASVVLAHHEFENWFIAAAGSLAGRSGLPANLAAPPDPERIRDAKGWLTDNMAGEDRYSPTLHQPAFSAIFDLDSAERCRSFAKFRSDVVRCLRQASQRR
jgi:hypothetical protein